MDVEHDDQIKRDEEDGDHIGDDNLAVDVVEFWYRGVDVESEHQKDETDDSQDGEDDLKCPDWFLQPISELSL